MTKVVHLTSAHPPRDVRIFHKEARSLAQAGYDVVVIVPGADNESVDGVRFRGIPRASGRLHRATFTQLALLRAAFDERADIYHFHDPELMIMGAILRAAGKRVVYDVHEDLPRQILHKPWIAPSIRKLVAGVAEAAEFVAARILSAIVTVTPTIARRFPAEKTYLVQNFPTEEEIGIRRLDSSHHRDCHAIYAGGIKDIRGAREMVEAIGLVSQTVGMRLQLAGDIAPPGLLAELQQMPGWSRVDFLGWRERAELREALAKATVGLVLFHALPNHINAQPNKLFEYMAAGLPVVASDFPLWREIIESIDCGILVDPRDPKAIAEAITWIAAHPTEARAMGQRGLEAVAKEYNWAAQFGNLLTLYRHLEHDKEVRLSRPRYA